MTKILPSVASDSKPVSGPTTVSLPQNFYLGVADADLQVIGEATTRSLENSEPSMWGHFARTSDRCFSHHTPDEGIDRYNRWRDDLALIVGTGASHYRTSVSMCRLLKRDGSVNEVALGWYREYLKTVKNAGLQLSVTLYHWELPQYLSAEGGWRTGVAIEPFLRHVELVHEHLSEFIDQYWILNEPWCSGVLGYLEGAHAPGESSVEGGILAVHHLLLAQARAVRTLKRLGSTIPISTVLNLQPTYPASQDPRNIKAAADSDIYFNRWFLEPIYLGRYPEGLSAVVGDLVNRLPQDEVAELRVGDQFNTLGINYYYGHLVDHTAIPRYGVPPTLVDGATRTDLGLPIFVEPHYPPGLYDMLAQIYRDYRAAGLKQITIAENGAPFFTPWDGESEVVSDPARIRYIEQHLLMVNRALQAGIPIDGYYVWTVMDNYEWAKGYKPRSAFGMVHVDRLSMKRIPKESYHWFSDICRAKRS